MHIVSRIKRKVGYLTQMALEKIRLSGHGGIVVLYHRVKELPYDPQMLAVTPSRFREHLRYYKKKYGILDPEEFLQHMLENKPLPQNTILVTFDDGYADNLTEAIPILESENVKAIFFVTTGYINSKREFWWDELEQIILGKEVLGRTFVPQHISLLNGITISLSDDTSRHRCYRRLIQILKDKTFGEREKELKNIADQFHTETYARGTHLPLDINEVKKLSSSPSAVIGAHTVNHLKLALLSPDEQQREISTSCNMLRQWSNKPLRYFAYPYGSKDDFNAASKQACRESNLEVAFSNQPGKIKNHPDLFALPRILVRNWAIDELAQHLPKS